MSKKGKTTSAISNKGTVEISTIKNNIVFNKRKLNNTATLNLLNGYASLVNHSFYRQTAKPDAYTPLYLGVGNCGSPTQYPPDTSLDAPYTLVGEINITKRIEVSVSSTNIFEENGVKGIRVVLNAIIPSSACANTKITEIGLFTSATIHSATMLARIPIRGLVEEGDTIDEYGFMIEPGTSLLIEWTIEIKNA